MISLDQLGTIIARGEQLDLEFKSDRRTMSDREIYEEVVSLANSKGGVLLIGVEDDGVITGAHPRHAEVTDPLKLQSAIFNNTVPSINTRISVIKHDLGQVIAIEVDPYPEPCATKSGKALHRTIKSDGKPESIPFYPRDQRSRRVDLGLLDFSAQVLEQLTFGDLDPLEFERLRQEIVRLRGDRSLLDLSNEEVAKALRLVETRHGKLVPNVAGLLLLGRENVIADVIPTHQVHFQVIDAQANVKVNDPFRAPLLKTLQEIGARFAARNESKGEKPRGYHLSANLYRKFGKSEGYVRAHGISPLRYEALAMEYVEAHGRIARKHVIELCGITENQAKGLLKKMCEKGKLQQMGKPRRGTYYIAME